MKESGLDPAGKAPNSFVKKNDDKAREIIHKFCEIVVEKFRIKGHNRIESNGFD